MHNPTIVLIADYGVGDPAFTEVILQLRHFLPDAHVFPQSTPAFSTINTGFWIYQIAQTENLADNTYIYSNTAPRKEDKEAQERNRGEKLMYAKLTDGFEVVAVNAGYNFSFIKPHIAEFREVNCSHEGSQFRSRDNFPEAVAKVVKQDPSVLGKKADVNLIPDHPRNVIASIDGYGNMKTTTKQSDVHLTPGQPLIIQIHTQKHIATYTDGVFNIKEGELAFAPGSSGHGDRFMELFVRGGNAHQLFNNPSVEEAFSLQPV